HIPAYKVRAVDTTAAGDSFTAALAVMLAQGKTIREAAEFANCVSAIVVTREGAQSSIPTLDEVMEYRSEIEKAG
ncbi:MAG: PfkB family carbohydrate kinase, partial [Lachnospiraceae bacterium]|nr:PfkB family carbohydrate kinase [Lachnospiraceae bacterium]